MLKFVIFLLTLILTQLTYSNVVPYSHRFDSSFGLEKASLECNADIDNIYSFTIPCESPLGPINLMLIQHDGVRKLPFSSTALYNSLNHQKLVDRVDNFRPYPCNAIGEMQTECTATFKMTPEQAEMSGRTAFDRGHLTPVNPMRFSESAADVTFYCVNIAPQDPFTNQGPWFTVEDGVHDYLESKPGYVMTGLCDGDSSDGTTLTGYPVPECFWKLVCYKDSAQVTRVVGFIAENKIVAYGDTNAENERTENTITPRSQAEILARAERSEFINSAWIGAQNYLLDNRDENNAPNPLECINAQIAPESVLDEWRDIMALHGQ